MPEGHVIHGVAAALNRLFAGQVVHTSSPQGRFTEGAALIDGCRFAGASAHGKHLFVAFERGGRAERILHVHLGLYGVWSFAVAAGHSLDAAAPSLLAVAAEGKQLRVFEEATGFSIPAPRGAVRLRLVGARAVADLNGPSRCEVLTPTGADLVHARLGPDPLREDTDPAGFIHAVRSSRRAIGVLLMEQSVIAGIGNIYRAELLFRHHLHPELPGHRVSARTLRHLWSDAVALLADGKRTGVIVTTDGGHAPAPPAGWTRLAERATDEEADQRWYAYRRNGRPCHHCGAVISAYTLANRTVYWCPECQRLPRS